jgi:hypothetical protein
METNEKSIVGAPPDFTYVIDSKAKLDALINYPSSTAKQGSAKNHIYNIVVI